MAFREPTFTEGLDQLNKGNFLGGLVLAAQGDLIKEQTLATQNVISTFSKRLQELESTPLSTDEQIAKLNADKDVTGNITNLQDMIGDYQSLTYSLFARQKMMNSIYGDTMNALAGIGGAQAENISKSLAGQHGVKTKELEQLADLPFKSLKFQETVLKVEETRADLDKKNYELAQLRDDTEAKNLFYKMIGSEDFATLQLERNNDTGSRKYSKTDFFKKMYLQHGNNPAFTRAMAGVDEYQNKHTMSYNPESPRLGGTNGSSATLAEHDLTNQNLYTWLRDNTSFWNTMNNSQDPFWGNVREKYFNAVKEQYPEEWSKASQDPMGQYKVENQKFFRFGMDRGAIELIEDDTAKDRALQANNLMYNPHSDIYYPKYLKQFSQGLRQDITGDKLANGVAVDPLTGRPYKIMGFIATGGRYAGIPGYEVNPGSLFRIDNQILGNPDDIGDPETLQGVNKSGQTKEMMEKTEYMRKKKETEKNYLKNLKQYK